MGNNIVAGVLYQQSLIAMAAYADLKTDMSKDTYLKALIKAGLTADEAKNFSDRYIIAGDTVSSWTGLQTTPFRDKTDNYKMNIGVAGSNGPMDFTIADVQKFLDGYATPQYVAFCNTIRDWKNSGVINATELFNMAAHSIGGDPVQMFGSFRTLPDNLANQLDMGYTFNSPGLGGYKAEFLTRTGITDSFISDSHVINVIANDGLNIISGYGQMYGNIVYIPGDSHFLEDAKKTLKDLSDLHLCVDVDTGTNKQSWLSCPDQYGNRTLTTIKDGVTSVNKITSGWQYTPLTDAEVQAGTDTGIYVVQQDNILGDIAIKFGTTTEEFVRVNNIPESKITRYDDGRIKSVLIKPGEELIIPTKDDFDLTNNTTGITAQTPPPGENPNVGANGILISDGTTEVSMPKAYVDDGGLSNTVPASIVSGGVDPGRTAARDGNAVTEAAGAMGADLLAEYEGFGALSMNIGLQGGAKEFYVDPLVLDLNGDGVKLTDYGSDPVLFDSDHDGLVEQTGWVSAEDGIVVVDRNANGKIDDISETLSEYYGGQVGADGSAGTRPFANGFAALKSLDSNNDNKFDSSDTAWNSVKVWVDANHDGKSWNDLDNDNVIDAGEASELKTLAELGVKQINLASTAQSGLVSDGNEILATGNFIQCFDANGHPVPAGTAGATEVTRSAVAANFLSNPNGSTFTETGTGVIVTTQDGTNVAAVKAYTSHSTTGESMNAATLGVQNLFGGTGDDTLTGDAGVNWLAGSQGSDTFWAGAGDDVLIIDGDDLSENIHGGAGLDLIQVVGDKGVVVNLAQAEVEIAQGGVGDDVFIGGGTSSVFVSGGAGNDVIIGGAANDALSGEDGDDMIDGGAGNDILRGHRGKDYIAGGVGDDLIEGGLDDDILNGGAGNDVLNGGQGDDKIDGGAGIDAAKYSGSYADYRIMKTEEGTWVTDTVSGRDGTDFLTNVEKLSFKDLNLIDIDLASPMPVKDILTKDSTGVSFDRANAHLISKAQLFQNDMDLQGDTLHITGLYNIQGGTATLTAAGDVLFTPDANFKGLMGFKYTVADSNNNYTEIIESSTGNKAPMKAAVYLKTADIPDDPLAVDQWYLTDANIIPVWKDYTGKGVKIGQFEPGGSFAVTKEVLDYRHPDLQQNIDANWLADPTNLAGAGSEEKFSTHATLVAGVMVAAKNGEGAVGVAYDATVAGYFTDEAELLAADHGSLSKMKNYDVVNNSWGAVKNFGLRVEPDGAILKSYADAAAYGRNGLGKIGTLPGLICFDALALINPGGVPIFPRRQEGGNTNYSNVSNNRVEIVVGAINAQNDLGSLVTGQTPFSNPGASLLVSAPGSNITSTSRIVENDNGSIFGNDFEVTQGTSFATPIVSGIVALMLEANPKLGYRDVQEILALTAKKITDTNTTWQTNHAVNWNGGGMHFSHDYGFGEVDALAAVRLAETWMSQSRLNNEYGATASSATAMNMAIPDNNATGVSSTLNISADMLVEHAEVVINLDHANAGDIIVKLISPTGTESILVNRPGKAPLSTDTDRGDATFAAGSTNLTFDLTTTACWGEAAKGNWTLKVIDAATGATGKLNSWTLNVYGKYDSGGDNYVYTNEYATATTLTDSDGGYDTINAAAVTGDSTLNLNAGSTSTIAGKTLTIAAGTIIENAIGGDGNDTITGNTRNEAADCYDLAA